MKRKTYMKIGVAALASGAILQAVIAYAEQPSQTVTISAEQYAKLVELAQSPSQTIEEEAVKRQVRETLPPKPETTDEINRESPGP